MKKCCRSCIPACLTCQEANVKDQPKGKVMCERNMSEPVLKDENDKCDRFRCIDYKS